MNSKDTITVVPIEPDKAVMCYVGTECIRINGKTEIMKDQLDSVLGTGMVKVYENPEAKDKNKDKEQKNVVS